HTTPACAGGETKGGDERCARAGGRVLRVRGSHVRSELCGVYSARRSSKADARELLGRRPRTMAATLHDQSARLRVLVGKTLRVSLQSATARCALIVCTVRGPRQASRRGLAGEGPDEARCLLLWETWHIAKKLAGVIGVGAGLRSTWTSKAGCG